MSLGACEYQSTATRNHGRFLGVQHEGRFEGRVSAMVRKEAQDADAIKALTYLTHPTHI